MISILTTALLLFGLRGKVVEGSTPDNIGTEFIIGFMQNIALNYDVSIFISTQRTSIVDVQVTAPRHTGTAISESFSITAPTVKKLVFNPDIRMSGTALGSKAIYITASDEIVVVGTNQELYSNDGFLALPTDVLGKEYYTVTHYPPSQKCELLVVGVEDSTRVTITFGALVNYYGVTYDSKSYSAGNDLKETINRFDTLQLQSYDDLSGTKITSTKKVAVFSGNIKTNIGSGGSSDHLVEMMVGVDYWGKEFLTVPIPKRTVGDVFKFIASKSSTTVTLSGDCPSEKFVMNNPGSVVEKTISSSHYCHIEADNGIMLVQFVQSQQSASEPSDPAMMIIPAIPQYGADYTFSTPEYSLGSYDNHFMFVIKDADRTGLRWNGNDISSSAVYKSIAGTDYVGGYLMVPEGTHTIKHTSPIKVFGGYIYGNATYETYAFPTGMRLAQINIPCNPVAMVIGDGLDNDCDGLIDEELCTPSGQDEDGDGSIDEDCVDIDECSPNPCQNSGTCVDGIAQYSCRCQAGYTDTTCSTDIDECASNPCLNSGTCNDAVNRYTCSCMPGYTGTHCGINIDECASNPCQHGRCVDEVNQYTCNCDPGYTGVNCQTNIDECDGVVCQNGGTCNDGINKYTCQCMAGFTGTHCETNIDECASGPCQNGGTCVDDVNRYTCDCVPGYTDTHCNTDIDECASSPCQNGGSCNDRVNGYTCDCIPGYTDSECQTDINECDSSPCENNATCNDRINKYDCSCAAGFTGTNCETNIDECASSPCDTAATCVDGINEFTCICQPGYMGILCNESINECDSNPCQNGGECSDKENAYECTCPADFSGDNCETAASSSVAAIAGGVAGSAAAAGLAIGAGRLLKKKFFSNNNGQPSGPSSVGPTSEEVLCTAPPPSMSMPRSAWK